MSASYHQYQPIVDDNSLHRTTVPVYQQNLEKDIEMIHSSSIGNNNNNDNNLYNQNDKQKSRYFIYIGIVMFFFVSLFSFLNWSSNQSSQPFSTLTSSSGSEFDDQGRYIMRNFDKLKPMSNFLNGLGGLWGVPMWAFYVNRGQGIASFGKQNKDGAILKFNTAEKAYQDTPFIGFRTFVKGSKLSKSFQYMPFFPRTTVPNDPINRDMIIGSNEMEIQEVNPDLGLQTNILYFTVPDEDFPSLVRSTTFTNLDANEILTIEVLDGLGRLIPSGLSNGALDGMGRTMEAWMNVYNVGSASKDGGGSVTQPFFHISQDTADTAQVNMIKDGHFALSFIDGGFGEQIGSDGLHNLLSFIVDPSVVYDTDTTLTDPIGFFATTSPSIEELLKKPQGTTSRTPCAFSGTKLVLPPGKSVTMSTVFGHADNLETFVGKYSDKIRTPGYTKTKRSAAKSLVEQITKKVETHTSSPIFDAYVKQDFLDNVLRGGLPIPLGTDNNNDNDKSPKKIFHTFSRIHGDIERDYNFFQLDTTYFSQGPGNFRDVSQNRRLDVFHTPAVGDFNVRMFLSYVQADGYNPLTVASTNFKIPVDHLPQVLSSMGIIDSDGTGKSSLVVKSILSKSFRPGQFFRDVSSAGVKFSQERGEVLNQLMEAAEQVCAAQYAQNGFWADHWTYTLDLVDNYLSVFPDKEELLLFDSEPLPFFMSPAVVKSRLDRYTLVDNVAKPGTSTIRVYGALSTWGDKDFPPMRQNAMNNIFQDSSFVADPAGAGGVWQRAKNLSVYKVSAAAKLIMLGLLKFSTMDPLGMGVEMEGGKPGWNDAMNGLPGILGSGMSETYEMFRILRFVKSSLVKFDRHVKLPVEFGDFVESLSSSLDTFFGSDKDDKAEFVYWDSSNTARETYRSSVVSVFQGVETSFSATYLVELLSKMEVKIRGGINKALATNNGLSPSYFYYECTSYEMVTPTIVSDPPPPTKVVAKSFKMHTLPLFLEGPTRHLKVIDDVNERKKLYELVKKSGLYDKALKMYTLSESLVGMGQDIGRMMAFSPGWLENQSVWLHMSYKFYLELLRGGLYEEFFAEISTGLVPFMDNKIYGRSPLEAASFIVSSAFPDPKLHGASFLARLSGSTAELLSMWALMMSGHSPFSLDNQGQLQLKLSPILPGWLFSDDGTVTFTFLGSIQVTYVNPDRLDTWKIQPKSASIVDTNGHSEVDDDAVFGSFHAQKVRDLKVTSIIINY